MKNLQFLTILIEIFPILSKMFSNFIEFFVKIWAKFRKFYKCVFVAGSGAAPEANEFIKILVEKSTETCNFLIIFMNYEKFLFTRLI